jgi:hypothetical protein
MGGPNCKNICKRFPNIFANVLFQQPNNKLNYDIIKYCRTCHYIVSKHFKNVFCSCCGSRYRLSAHSNKYKKLVYIS